jgi:hypothetical protein
MIQQWGSRGWRGAFFLFLPAFVSCVQADETWLYAVQITATIQESPPQITLTWLQDLYGANSYTVHRKAKSEGSWGPGVTLPGTATSYTDTSVSVGGAYEYQIVKQATLGYTGYGYIYAGIKAPLQDDRGTIVLVVAKESTAGLDFELQRLQTDLAADGWFVIRHDVSVLDAPASVRGLIANDYYGAPSQVNTVFLFGHVPVVMAGYLDYDSHGSRAMPADACYGDVDGDWRLDQEPTNRPSFLPSDVELCVGRVDFFNMPGVGAPVPWPSETELLRNYLNKDHAWRQKQVTVPRRALMANRVGDYYGAAYAASGYRNFEPFVGHGNIIEANVQDNAPVSQRWISYVSSGGYLWTYGCGGGQDNIISELGTHGQYNDVWSTDIVYQDAKAVFSMLFGSHFGDWTVPDNVMRAMLATPSLGLTACMVGIPHWFCHHMGLGETIGYGTRLSMNNFNLYQVQSNILARCVFTSLMGDPTLRMDMAAPPGNLSAVAGSGSVSLSWQPSADSVIGYHIYSSASAAGPFTRLTAQPIQGLQFTDYNPISSAGLTYMVRSIALTANPSGSFYNASEGAIASVSFAGTVPIVASASAGPGGITISWNSQSGRVYHVWAVDALDGRAWRDLSGGIDAYSATTAWIDTDISSTPARFYRISVD